jgi:hypothetical protein
LTPSGDILVEGPVDSVEVGGGPILTETGEPVVSPHTYYLLDATWTIKRRYGSTTSSVDDSLYGAVCKVDGDALYEHWTEWNSYPGKIRSVWRNTEITGLVSVPLDEVPGWQGLAATAEQAVTAALADYHRRRHEEQRERQRPLADLAARFSATLPDYPGTEPVDLVFGYADGALVREPDGRVLWRLTEQWPYRGKDLYEFLGNELRRRYQNRLGTFRTDIDSAPWWFWAPDL